MTFLTAVAEQGVWIFGLLLLVAQFAAHEAGYRLGASRRDAPGVHSESVSIVVSAMLGLLTFVLALTLSFTSARFAERRAGAMAEANAIGTAWMRAEAIGGPRGEEIGRLIERYLDAREDLARVGRDEDKISDLNRQTNALQTAIWGHATAIIRERPDPVTASLMSSLNEMFDASATERYAFQLRLPPQLFWLLTLLTLLTVACLGFQLGVGRRPQRILVLFLTAMWSAVIVDILDFASPHLGNFRTDVAAYEWTRQGFANGVSISPLPSGK